MKVRISFEVEFDENGDAADYGSKEDILESMEDDLPTDFGFTLDDMVGDAEITEFTVQEVK